QHAVAVLDRDDCLAAGDALAGILRLVLHDLLGRDVVGQRHTGSLQPAAVVHDRLAMTPDLVLRHVAEARPGDDLHPPHDVALQAGAPVPETLLGGVDERFHRPPPRLFAVHVALEALLQRVTRVLASRALREILGLLVPPAGDVVLEQAPDAGTLVEAGEDRHDHQALHRHRQVHADHLPELVGFAFEREVLALDLLVVLELCLEQPGHLHGRPRGAGNADPGQIVGLEDLLDVAVRDLIPLARLTVSRHHDAVTIAERQHGGAVRYGRHARRLGARRAEI